MGHNLRGRHNFSTEEQAFMREAGLQPDELGVLVGDCEPASPDVQARLLNLTKRKLGLDTAGEAAAPGLVAARGEPSGPSRKPRSAARTRLGWFVAVAASLIIGAAITAGGPYVHGALQRMAQFVPGFGITGVTDQTLVLAEPVTVGGSHGQLTVTAFLATPDHTELRLHIDGFSPDKPGLDDWVGDPDFGKGFDARLILPDGTRLRAHTTAMSAGSESVEAHYWFPALPASASAVTLHLPGYGEYTETFSAELPLLPIEEAGLAKAAAGGWSAEKDGVTMGVPHVAVTDDRIVLSLTGVIAEGGARLEEIGAGVGAPAVKALILTDNLGNEYPLIGGESHLYYSSHRSFEAVFNGPVQPGAESFQLTVGSIQVIEKGAEARLRVPLNRLNTGETVHLGERLTVGDYPALVDSVTRASEDRFLLNFHFDDPDHQHALRYIFVHPYNSAGGSSVNYLGKGHFEAEITYTPRGGYLDVGFGDPVLLIEGPWLVDFPVP